MRSVSIRFKIKRDGFIYCSTGENQEFARRCLKSLEIEEPASSIEIAEAESLVKGKNLVVRGIDFKVDGDHAGGFGFFQNGRQEHGTDPARTCGGRNVKFFEGANETAMFGTEESGGVGHADDLGIVASEEEKS